MGNLDRCFGRVRQTSPSQLHSRFVAQRFANIGYVAGAAGKSDLPVSAAELIHLE